MNSEYRDDDLTAFKIKGALPLPANGQTGTVDHLGAKIWYSSFGGGRPVFLLHGGLGHSGNWGHQVPALTAAGYRVIVLDSRGHGRSTRDLRPFTYELLAADVFSVMDHLGIEKAPMIGWSDGACTGLVMSRKSPARIQGVFFFACNMDSTGTKDFAANPIVDRCFTRHIQDYAELSSTPTKFKEFVDALNRMQRNEPQYSAKDLAEIDTKVTIAIGEFDEFVKRDHMEYLAKHIPDAELLILPNVSHFAPLQRPREFNEAVLIFLRDH